MKLLPRLIIVLLICLIAIPVLAVPAQLQAAVPSVTVSPDSGNVGDRVTIRGYDFGSGEEVDIYYYFNGDRERIEEDFDVGTDGNFTYKFDIPESYSGQHDIRVYYDSSWKGDDFTVEPKIEMDDDEGFVGDEVEVTGTGFAEDEEDITIRYGDDVVEQVEEAETDEYGTWTAAFIIPESAGGKHDIDAKGDDTGYADVDEVEFTVKPRISLNPKSGSVGDIVTVTATGFGDEEANIKIKYDDEEVPQIEEAETDDLGSWTATFEVPPSVEGSYKVDARGKYTEYGEVADVTFTVVPGPVWSVGGNWVYSCSYENPGGKTEQDTCELEVTVVGEEAVGDEACYKCSGGFDPPATRDAADMPLTLHVGDVDIWNSKDHMEYVKTSSAIAELPGLPSTVTWNYTGDYGWPYDVGKTWNASVHVVAGVLDETTEVEFKVLGVETVTVPAGTFECYHIVTYEPASPDNYTYEHWFNETAVKSDVKMIDRFLWAGEETRELVSYSGGTPPVQYNLTISSTSGGNVTILGEGTFACYAGEVVDLVATADTGYQFVNWTGDVGTIADVDSAATNVVMTGNYSITANFGEKAAEVNAEWSKVGTPYTDDWTIAPQSDILVPASIPGGEVIYVVGSGHEDNNLDENWGPRFWKSDDSGVSWDDLADNVWDADGLPASFNPSTSYFNYVACALDDSDFVAVAVVDSGAAVSSYDYCNMTQTVVISDDGGKNFYWMGDVSDSTSNATFSCVFDMKVSNEDTLGKRNIAIGGVGTRNGTCNTGLVFRYETGGLTGGRWVDASAYDGWDNTTDSPSQAVTKVAFAPSWLDDKVVLAVSHSATNSYLQSGTWGNATRAWNADAGFEPAVQIIGADQSIWSFFCGAAAGLALPTDYEGRHSNTRYAWVYVDNTDGSGVIYRVTNGAVVEVAQQITDNPWLASLSYYGDIAEGKAIVGLLGDGNGLPTECCEGVQVYRNDGITDMDICCERWSDACKPPTGTMAAMVLYVSPNKAYAFVGGTGAPYEEGAFSFSLDDGDTWNQVGLVDTYVNYLSDVTKSADCSKTWVVSVNTAEDGVCECDSVWLKASWLPEASEYSGAWIREWCEELEGDYEEGLLRLAPEETEEALTVYLVDRGTSMVYYDGTEGLGCWEEGTSTVDEISDLAVQDEATIYAVGFDADVAVSDDHGAAASWSSTMDSKVVDGHTIAVLGEGNVLVGGADGKVAYSDDNLSTFLDGEASFTELDDIGDGDVHVAFDSYFDSNSVIYTAVGDGGDDNGIYRWVIDASTSWTDLGECAGTATPTETQLGLGPSCTPIEVDYYGIVLSYAEGNPETDATTGGVLYTAYAWWDNVTDTYYTGVARCLNPAEEVACGEAMWDYLIQGLSAEKDEAFYAEPSSLKICGCLTPYTNSKLYAIDWNSYYYGGYYCPDFATNDEDSSRGRLWTYEDCYGKSGPVLVAPADGAVVSCDPHYWWNDAFTLKWDRQCDACSYNLQISLDEDFTGLLLDISGRDGDCTEIDYEPSSGTNPSYVVEEGALGPGSCGTTFYWRVCSADAETGEVIHSPWSEARSFTVGGGAERDVVRNLPDVTYPGDTFDVFVNFTAPVDEFNAIGLTDLAPDGWEVAVDTAWCTPNADAVKATDNRAEIAWFGEPGVGFDNGTPFTAMYKVTIPDDAEPGINEFPLGDCSKAWLGYYVGGWMVPYTSCITGEHEVTVTVTIDVIRDLPPDALDFDAEYPGDTFDVYVNFTAPVDDFNGISLTDLAPAGWEVETNVTWCDPVADWTMHPYNKAEYAWEGPFLKGQNFSAKYKVTIPATASPGINEWPNCTPIPCPPCEGSPINSYPVWLEYWFGPKGPYESCITGEYQKIVTVPGCVVGETRDVNGDLLDTVLVTLYETPVVWEDNDSSSIVGNVTKYENCANDTGYYYQTAQKYCYYEVDTRPQGDGGDMPAVRNPAHPDYIDWSTPELLAAGFTMDFVGDYGLVCKAASMSYAMESVNHWLFVPTDAMLVPQPDWQLSNWKAMESVHSWQFPCGCNC